MGSIRSLFETQDMTEGRPLTVLAKFSVPLLISWVIGTVLSILAYRKGAWREKLPQRMREELAAEKAAARK